MSSYESLDGACSCGRNQYTIHLPSPISSPSQATLVFDTSLTSRQTHSTPLPTFLRIPLHSLASSTHAYYPDETHGQIRKVFTPGHAPLTKRHFCGFCGTELSFWQEDEADREVERWVYVNLGTLEEEGVERLEEAGVLSAPEEQDRTEQKGVLVDSRQGNGQPWFEELIRDTGIGRIRQARGGQVSGDGKSTFEWRIVEFDGEVMGGYADDEEGAEYGPGSGTPKRKVDEMSL